MLYKIPEKSQNATELINSWISDKTHGKIAKMYPETIDSNTLIMLVSSLYFKASWANKFTPMEEIKVKSLTVNPLALGCVFEDSDFYCTKFSIALQ